MENGASSYRHFLAGDDNGIVEIINEYKDGLILYLNQYVSDIHAAEDLAEDTFFKLMIKKPRYTPRYTFRAWLYAIGRNAAVDYIRKQSRQVNTPAEDLESLSAEEECFEQACIREEEKRLVHKALKKLLSGAAAFCPVYLSGK